MGLLGVLRGFGGFGGRNLGEFVILSVAKNPKNLRYALNLWIATLALWLARNDSVGFLGVLAGLGGILFLGWLGNFCFLGLGLGFWFCGGFEWNFFGVEFGEICHFEPFAKRRKIHIVILSVSEISTEFKTRFKTLKSHFDFMDTSLSCESSV